MKKSLYNLNLLQTICITCTVVSPIVASKLIDLHFSLFGVSASVPGSALIYAFIFVLSNMISEGYGQKRASVTAVYGFVCQIVATVLLMIIQVLPTSNDSLQSAYVAVLGSNIVFTVSGILTYVASQSCNIWLYNKIKVYKHSSLANAVSASISQLLDTVLFLGLSYGLMLRWFMKSETSIQLVVMMLSQYIIRMFVTFLISPIFHLVIKSHKK